MRWVGLDLHKRYITACAEDDEGHVVAEHRRLPADENLVLRLLREHVFHCGSILGQALLDGWRTRRTELVRIVPLAQDIVDFRAIYDQQVAARMGMLLNE